MNNVKKTKISVKDLYPIEPVVVKTNIFGDDFNNTDLQSMKSNISDEKSAVNHANADDIRTLKHKAEHYMLNNKNIHLGNKRFSTLSDLYNKSPEPLVTNSNKLQQSQVVKESITEDVDKHSSVQQLKVNASVEPMTLSQYDNNNILNYHKSDIQDADSQNVIDTSNNIDNNTRANSNINVDIRYEENLEHDNIVLLNDDIKVDKVIEDVDDYGQVVSVDQHNEHNHQQEQQFSHNNNDRSKYNTDKDKGHKSGGGGFFSKRNIISFIFLIIAVLFISYIFLQDEKQEKKVLQIEKESLVSVDKVKLQSFNLYEKTIGSIYNLNSAVISSEVSGLIEDVYIDVGDHVKAGDLLAKIDEDEFVNNVNSQKAEVSRIRAVLNDALLTQARYNKLINDGFVSQAELDTINSDVEAYKEQLKNNIAILENNKIKLKKTAIHSTVDGVVQERYITKGDFVSVSNNLFDIVNNKSLIVIASLPEVFSYKLNKGQKVNLKITGTDINIDSKIKEIKPVIDKDSRTTQIIMEIENNKYQLKPGGTLEVWVLMDHKINDVLISEVSVVFRKQGKVVYVVQDDNRVKEVPVKTGAYQNGNVEILAGLKGGETIVTEGAEFLSDGALIKVKNNQNEQKS